MSEEINLIKKKNTKKIKHLEKQLDEKQDAVNISNQRTDKKNSSLLLIIIIIH